jgi:7-keto-8-aminopelargonate synthetase-like enzyme
MDLLPAVRDVTVWCSNDYLGMSQNAGVRAAMHEAIEEVGAGSGDKRNISGTTHYHVELEAELADLHGKEAALLFTSAYIANDATLSTLQRLMPGLVIFSDEKNHASMIEGIRRGGGAKHIFRHNDAEHLEELLNNVPAAARPRRLCLSPLLSLADRALATVPRHSLGTAVPMGATGQRELSNCPWRDLGG